MLAIPMTIALILANTPPPPVTSAVKAAIVEDLKALPDAKAIDSHPDGATRLGRVLRFNRFAFVDEGECDGSGCARYRLDAVWPGGVVGVSLVTDENSDYYLLDAMPTPIGGRPIISPDGRSFFVGFLNEMTGDSAAGLPSSIAIWRFSHPGLGLTRIRTVDIPVAAFSKFTAWRGNRCVEFIGLRNYGQLGGYKEKTLWLMEESMDWTLHEERPAGCP